MTFRSRCTRRLLSLGVAAALAVAVSIPARAVTTQEQMGLLLGWFPPSQSNGTSTLQLNAAGTWLAMSWVQNQTKTLSKVRLFISAIAGAPIGNDATLDLFSDSSAGIPNASLEGPKQSSGGLGALSAATWLEWTGFSTSVTAGTRYWVVAKNANALPGTNNFTFRFGNSGTGKSIVGVQGNTTGWGWSKVHTTNSGTSWAGGSLNNVCGIRLEYSDGSFDGFPVQNIASIGVANAVFGTQEVGVKFTTPANGSLNIRGVAFPVFQTGTPTGNLQYRLYDGSTGALIATTAAVPIGTVPSASSAAYIDAYFSATQSIAASTSLRVVVSETSQSDTSAKAYRFPQYTIDSDGNSAPLLPFQGTLQKTSTTDSTAGPPPTWSEDTSFVYPFVLILDTDGEFASTGGSTGAPLSRVRSGF